MGLSKERKKLIQRLRSPRLRAREGLFLVEGVRGVREFLGATIPMEIRFALVSSRLEEVRGGTGLREDLLELGLPFEAVDDQDLEALSDTEQTQGILLVVKEPESFWPPVEGSAHLRFLLLDGIQDPGNVGTLVRAARAFSLDGVLALEGTADPWSPKAVRGGAGASAHVPVCRVTWTQARHWLDERGLPILVAEAGGTDVRTCPPFEGWALVLGNEGAGVRPEIREGAAEFLAIPIAGGVDSLNVATAGAILLFALGSTTEPHGRV